MSHPFHPQPQGGKDLAECVGPLSNTGRKSGTDFGRSVAFVDWLGVSFKIPETIGYPMGKDDPICQSLRETLHSFCFEVFGIFQVEERRTGWAGYLYRWNLGPEGAHGWIAFGGANQRRACTIHLTGSGCAAVKDWASIIWWGKGIDQHFDIDPETIRITRLDLAHDDVEAKNVSIETAKGWYADGLFITAGRPPTPKLIDDFDSGEGKTFYIGKRENGKVCRIYEKGREQGDPNSEWVRIEVEWHGKDRWIPWDAVESPAQYLAAAYPALDWLHHVKAVIRTVSKAAKMTADSIRRWLRNQAGPALYALEQMHGGVTADLWQSIRREKWPARLAKYDHTGLELKGLLA